MDVITIVMQINILLHLIEIEMDNFTLSIRQDLLKCVECEYS